VAENEIGPKSNVLASVFRQEEAMKGRLFAGITVLLAFVALPLTGYCQFGGLVKKSKFKTKPIKKLIKEIGECVGEYEDATARVWSATETVQELVKQYTAGEFPVLTKTWGEIRKTMLEAKEDAEKAAAVELSRAYLKEMVERKKAMEAFFNDPAKTADVQGKLQPPEMEKLNSIVTDLTPVPEKDTKLIARSKDLTEKAGKAVKDLTKQIKKNPLKAGDYKKLLDKLNDGLKELGKMPEELQKQISAINTMLGNIQKLLKK